MPAAGPWQDYNNGPFGVWGMQVMGSASQHDTMGCKRRSQGHWRVLAAAMLAVLLTLLAGASQAQWTSNRGYQLLQRVDDVLFGVDTVSLQILDQRHVSGTLLHINVDKPYPVRGRIEFVVRCDKPVQLAIRAGDTSGPVVLDKLEFADVAFLDGSWAAAEFACESTRQPGRASQVAREMFEHGGPPDTQTVYCDLQPDGSTELRRGVQVRFSAQANAVAVNRQWLSSGSVTANEVRFGANSTWRINRKSLDVRRTSPRGEMLFSGLCDRRPPARK